MKICVIGGAGYIGSHAVRRCVQSGHEVTVWDNLSHGHKEAIDTRALFIKGDVRESDRLTQTLQERSIEAVLHFAALIEVGESVVDPAKYYANNLSNGLALLEALRAARVPKLVFSSTAAVYGSPHSTPLTEDHPISPINPYGRTKAMMELAIRDFAEAYGLEAACLRYFNVAGASPDGELGEAHEPESHLIPRILSVALGQTSHLSIFGADYPTPDGTCIRDYVHIEDLVTAHLLALESLQEGQTLTYNVGSQSGFSVLDVIECCRSVTGHPIPTQIKPRRAGDPAVLLASSEKIRRELDWHPQFPTLRPMIEDAWRWHRKHPHGYAHTFPEGPRSKSALRTVLQEQLP